MYQQNAQDPGFRRRMLATRAKEKNIIGAESCEHIYHVTGRPFDLLHLRHPQYCLADSLFTFSKLPWDTALDRTGPCIPDFRFRVSETLDTSWAAWAT